MKRARDDNDAAEAAAPLMCHDLRARLNALEFGLQPGDATIEVAGHNAAVARQRVLPRDDGTVVDRINPVGIDPATGLPRQPVWSTTAATDASYDRRWNEAMQAWQNPLEHEPWTPALRILAGATGTTIERLLDPESLRNVTQYDAQMREWASKERENRMMPASEKQRHINTLTKERTALVTSLSQVRQTGEPLRWMTELLHGLATCTGMDAGDLYGLGALVFVDKQFDTAEALRALELPIAASVFYKTLSTQFFAPADDTRLFDNALCRNARAWLRATLDSDNNNNNLSRPDVQKTWVLRILTYLVLRHELAAPLTKMRTLGLPVVDTTKNPPEQLKVVKGVWQGMTFPELAINTLQHALIVCTEYKSREFELWKRLQDVAAPAATINEYVPLVDYTVALKTAINDNMERMMPKDTELELTKDNKLAWQTMTANMEAWQAQIPSQLHGTALDVEALRHWLTAMTDEATEDRMLAFCGRVITKHLALLPTTIEQLGAVPAAAKFTPDVLRTAFCSMLVIDPFRVGIHYRRDAIQSVFSVRMTADFNARIKPGARAYTGMPAFVGLPMLEFNYAAEPLFQTILHQWERANPNAVDAMGAITDPEDHKSLWSELCAWLISSVASQPTGGDVFFDDLFFAQSHKPVYDATLDTQVRGAWTLYYTGTDYTTAFDPHHASFTPFLLKNCILAVKVLTGEFLAYGKAFMQRTHVVAPNDAFMATLMANGPFRITSATQRAVGPIEVGAVATVRNYFFSGAYTNEKADAHFWSIRATPAQRQQRLGLFDWLSEQERLTPTVVTPPNTNVLLSPYVENLITLWQKKILGEWPLALARALKIVIVLGSYQAIVTHALELNAHRLIAEIDDTLTVARDEWRRLVTDTDADMQRIVQRARALYTASRSWNLRPEFTGRIQLSDLTINALDEAYSRVREYLPDLRHCTLDQLGTASRDSGLVGAFMRLVATGTAALRLRFQTQYNTEAQHKASPKNQQDAMTALRAFAVRFGGADGKTVVSVQRRCGDGATLTYPVPAPPP